MLNMKKIGIGALATIGMAIVVDTTITMVKCRDWFAIISLIKKMIISIESGALGADDQLISEGMEIVEKINVFFANKKVKNLSKEERNELRILRKELENFYSSHCE